MSHLPGMGAREHFGRGRLATDPTRSVFINCPFDPDFLPLFDAIVFAVVCCDYIPRSALESGTVAESRMDRIVRSIFSSKYSIHDLSRCRGEGGEQLARFNMPLELGIAMARRFMPAKKKDRHDWLLLVPSGHVYLKFVSDLAAWDPKSHDSTIESVVPQVVGWLATRVDTVRARTPQAVLEALPEFQEQRAKLDGEWRGNLQWSDLVACAMDISQRMG